MDLTDPAFIDLRERAATLDERLHSMTLQRRETSADARHDWMAAWRDNVAEGDPERFASIMATRGRSPAELDAALSDVAIADPHTGDPWNLALLELFDGFVPSPSDGEPIAAPLAGFGNAARRWVAALAQRSSVALGERARQAVLEHVLDHWRFLVTPTLFSELHVANAMRAPAPPQAYAEYAARLGSPAAWWEVLGHYPVLGRLIAERYLDWKAMVQRLLDRVAADAALLAAQLGVQPEAVQSIADLELGMGDLHDRGETVAIVHFAGGAGAVYKPRDLRIAAWFMTLIEWLAQRTAVQLSTRWVLPRAGYGWEELVGTASTTPAGARRFYHRAGMLLRVLQLIDGRDFHHGNVRCRGEWLELLDLEALFQPRTRAAEEMSPSLRAAWTALRESPIPVALLPEWQLGDKGSQAIRSGGLAMGGRFVVPAQVPVLARPLAADGRYELARASFAVSPTVPRVDGQVTDPADHVEDVIAGYREVERAIAAHAVELSALLEQARGLPVRSLPRFTQVYAHFIFESIQPYLLGDGRDRDLFLERLFLAYRDDWEPLAHLIDQEIEAVRAMDVPLFSSPVDSDHVATTGGQRIAGYVVEPSLARVLRRLAPTPRPALAQDLALIRTAITSVYGTPTAPPPVRHAPAGLDELRAAVGELAATIVDAAIAGSDGGLAWIATVHRPSQAERPVLGVAPPDLLSGVCGVAIALAVAFRITGEPCHAAAARGALVEVTEAMWRLRRSWRAAPDLAVLHSGPFLGWSGHVYALWRCGALLDDRGLVELGSSQLDALPWPRVLVEPCDDVMSGCAGLLLMLEHAALRRRDLVPPPPCVDVAQRLLQRPGPAVTYRDPVWTRIPGGAAGRRLATAAHERRTRTDRALARPAAPGTVGDALAAIHLDPARAGALAAPLLGDPRLDLADRMELLVTAFHATRDAEHLVAARSAAAALIAQRRITGAWLAAPLVDRTHLSIVSGLSGVVLALARAHSPDIGSVRLLELDREPLTVPY